MSIAIDQANVGEFAQDTASAAIAMTTGNTVALNGFIALYLTWLVTAGQTLSNVTGGGLAWSIDIQDSTGSTGEAWVSAQAPSGLASGTTLTGNLSASVNGARSLTATSFTGVKTSSPVDVTAARNATTASTAWATNNMTTQAGSVLLGGSFDLTSNHTSTPTAPSIETHDIGGGAGSFEQTVAYRIEASPGTYTVAGTWSGSATGATIGVAYLAATTGSVGAFLVSGHTGLDRISNVEAWLKTNFAGWLPFTATGLDRLANIEVFLTANPVNAVTFLPYGKTGTDRLWNIESYLLKATSSNG